jgi:hypothetical protein
MLSRRFDKLLPPLKALHAAYERVRREIIAEEGGDGGGRGGQGGGGFGGGLGGTGGGLRDIEAMLDMVPSARNGSGGCAVYLNGEDGAGAGLQQQQGMQKSNRTINSKTHALDTALQQPLDQRIRRLFDDLVANYQSLCSQHASIGEPPAADDEYSLNTHHRSFLEKVSALQGEAGAAGAALPAQLAEKVRQRLLEIERSLLQERKARGARASSSITLRRVHMIEVQAMIAAHPCSTVDGLLEQAAVAQEVLKARLSNRGEGWVKAILQPPNNTGVRTRGGAHPKAPFPLASSWWSAVNKVDGRTGALADPTRPPSDGLAGGAGGGGGGNQNEGHLPDWIDRAFDPGIKTRKYCESVVRYKYAGKGGYRRVVDAASVSLHFHTSERLLRAKKELESMFKVVAVENRYGHPCCSGARDVKILVELELPEELLLRDGHHPLLKHGYCNRHIAEIRLLHVKYADASEEMGETPSGSSSSGFSSGVGVGVDRFRGTGAGASAVHEARRVLLGEVPVVVRGLGSGGRWGGVAELVLHGLEVTESEETCCRDGRVRVRDIVRYVARYRVGGGENTGTGPNDAVDAGRGGSSGSSGSGGSGGSSGSSGDSRRRRQLQNHMQQSQQLHDGSDEYGSNGGGSSRGSEDAGRSEAGKAAEKERLRLELVRRIMRRVRPDCRHRGALALKFGAFDGRQNGGERDGWLTIGEFHMALKELLHFERGAKRATKKPIGRGGGKIGEGGFGAWGWDPEDGDQTQEARWGENDDAVETNDDGSRSSCTLPEAMLLFEPFAAEVEEPLPAALHRNRYGAHRQQQRPQTSRSGAASDRSYAGSARSNDGRLGRQTQIHVQTFCAWLAKCVSQAGDVASGVGRGVEGQDGGRASRANHAPRTPESSGSSSGVNPMTGYRVGSSNRPRTGSATSTSSNPRNSSRIPLPGPGGNAGNRSASGEKGTNRLPDNWANQMPWEESGTGAGGGARDEMNGRLDALVARLKRCSPPGEGEHAWRVTLRAAIARWCDDGVFKAGHRATYEDRGNMRYGTTSDVAGAPPQRRGAAAGVATAGAVQVGAGHREPGQRVCFDEFHFALRNYLQVDRGSQLTCHTHHQQQSRLRGVRIEQEPNEDDLRLLFQYFKTLDLGAAGSGAQQSTGRRDDGKVAVEILFSTDEERAALGVAPERSLRNGGKPGRGAGPQGAPGVSAAKLSAQQRRLAELIKVCRRRTPHGASHKDALHHAMHTYDTDGDGRLSFSELLSAVAGYLRQPATYAGAGVRAASAEEDIRILFDASEAQEAHDKKEMAAELAKERMKYVWADGQEAGEGAAAGADAAGAVPTGGFEEGEGKKRKGNYYFDTLGVRESGIFYDKNYALNPAWKGNTHDEMAEEADDEASARGKGRKTVALGSLLRLLCPPGTFLTNAKEAEFAVARDYKAARPPVAFVG